MNGILLTWNPNRWSPSDESLEALEAVTPSTDPIPGRWSVGNHKNGIESGMRAFLVRQGNLRGIVATGVVTFGPYLDDHWDGSKRLTGYVEVDWDTWVKPEKRIAVEKLIKQVKTVPWNNLIGSGHVIDQDTTFKIDDLWADGLKRNGIEQGLLPDELSGGERFSEGVAKRIEVNRYERDPRARQAAIDLHGAKCTVCGFDFWDAYGELGRGFIEVHHVIPISELPPGYEVDPATDLLPLCSNCHSMIHRTRPAMTPDELRQRITTW